MLSKDTALIEYGTTLMMHFLSYNGFILFKDLITSHYRDYFCDKSIHLLTSIARTEVLFSLPGHDW